MPHCQLGLFCGNHCAYTRPYLCLHTRRVLWRGETPRADYLSFIASFQMPFAFISEHPAIFQSYVSSIGYVLFYVELSFHFFSIWSHYHFTHQLSSRGREKSCLINIGSKAPQTSVKTFWRNTIQIFRDMKKTGGIATNRVQDYYSSTRKTSELGTAVQHLSC